MFFILFYIFIISYTKIRKPLYKTIDFEKIIEEDFNELSKQHEVQLYKYDSLLSSVSDKRSGIIESNQVN